jgi:barbiturase
MPSAIEVRKVPIHSVSDASELTKLIDDGVIAADRVFAIIGKTEGNGGVNDYTRIIADRAFREALVAKGADPEQVKGVPIVWSGGTDGVISPHATIFATTDVPEDDPSREEMRLTAGFAMSEPLLPEEIGYTAMIEKVAAGVKVAMERAGITDPADVHYVQTKTPLLTIHTIRDAKSRGKSVWTEHTHESMDLSNGATGLGIAVALGEIEMPTDADVMHNRELYSSVASCSSGVELDVAQIVVVGNATASRRAVPDRPLGHEGRPGRRRHLGRHPLGRPRPAGATAHQRTRRQARQRVPQVRGQPGRHGPRTSQRDARRLRRPLAPPDQGQPSAA